MADYYLPLCVFIKGVDKMLELEDNLKELQNLKSKIESLGEFSLTLLMFQKN